jgi:D-glycero-D-manno-heptose 1,7-bisphosphate phosphatase
MKAAGAQAKVVILDRDGTIIIDRNYLSDPAGLEFLPGAAEGLRGLYEAGYRLVVITNQSGIGRGMFSEARLAEIHDRFVAMVEAAGAHIEAIYYCPHLPDAGCTCRKPAQGLMQQAAADLAFDPAGAVVIGDKESDVEFGRRAGAVTIFISSREAIAPATAADFVAADLVEAARQILSL